MAQLPYRLSQRAERDIAAILKKSLEDFGQHAAIRYKKLLSLALYEIGQEPQRVESRSFEKSIRIYHLRHTASRASVDGVKVGKPRHFIVYRQAKSGPVEIIRVLHDAMEIERHLD